MKFATLIAKGIPKRFGYGDIMNFQHGTHGSHFSKWPPETTVFLWVIDIIWYFRVIYHTWYMVLGKCILDNSKLSLNIQDVWHFSRWQPSLLWLSDMLDSASPAELAKWFHEMDHTHTARWIPVHLRDMAELPRTHPSVAQALRAGKFTVQKTKNVFPWADECLH